MKNFYKSRTWEEKSQPSRAIFQGIFFVLLLLGTGLRITIFLQNRSLFMDEANLASNICGNSFAGLFAPLAYQQYAPPLFSAACKAATEVLGCTDQALRLIPLLSGLLGFGIFALLALRLIRYRPVSLLLIFLFAFSPRLLRYATEVKQYGTDLLVGELLVFAALAAPARKNIHFLWWGLGGALAIWLSMPAVFFLAAIGLKWSWEKYRGGAWHTGALAACFGLWLVSFLLYYLLILQQDIGQPGLQAYHQGYMLTGPYLEVGFWLRIGRHLLSGWFRPLTGYTAAAYVLGIGLFAVGVWMSVKKWWAEGVLLLLPLLLCLAASALGKYSLIERLLLFQLPLILFLMGKGGSWVLEKTPPHLRLLWLLPLLLILPLNPGWKHFTQPLIIDDSRGLLLLVEKNYVGPTPLYIHPSAVPSVRFYLRHSAMQNRFSFSERSFFQNTHHPQEIGELAGKHSETEIWILFAHLVSKKGWEELQQAEAWMLQHGQIKEQLRTPNCRAFLFHLGSPGTR